MSIIVPSFIPDGNKVVCENEMLKNVFISKGVINFNSIFLPATKLDDYCYVAAGSFVSGISPLDSMIVRNSVSITRKLKNNK